MKFRKILNGILALLVTSCILLISDWSNRSVDKAPKELKSHTGLAPESGRHYKIGLTYFAPESSFDLLQQGLRQGLKDLGYVEGENLDLNMVHANGEIANLPLIHMNMDNSDVDLIIPTSTPGIQSAISTVKKHKMVFTYTFTPLAAGAGKSFTDHLPNLTGVASFPPVERTLDFICDSFPGVKRIGTIYNTSEINSVKVAEVGKKHAEEIGVELVESTIVNTSEVYQAASTLAMRNVDAIWVSGDNTALQAFQAIVKVCNDNNLPLIVNDVDFTKQGALAAVGIGWFQTGYNSAPYVARVLNGEDPAGIPIINYVEEEISINEKLAKERGIVFPEKYIAEKVQKRKEPYKFCLVHYVDSPNSEQGEEGVRDGLKSLGWDEGKDFTLKTFNAQGDITTVNSISDAVAAQNWDMVFVTSTPTTQVLSHKIKNAPVVFSAVGDPVAAGLGETMENHIGNVTGVSTMSDFSGLLKLVKDTMPDVKTIGTIFCPGEVNSESYKEHLKEAAEKLGLKVVSVAANSVTEVQDAAMSLANQNVDVFTQISDNLTASCSTVIIKTAYDHHIPYFGFTSGQISQGAVACVARDYYDAGFQCVQMGKRVLDGEDAKNIPFSYLSTEKIYINKDAEKHFSLKVPEQYVKESVKWNEN